MSIDKVSNPIEMHHFSHPLYKARKGKYDTLILELPITHNTAKLHKQDVIAMAKHFKLTAHDIDCSEHKALQADADAIDDIHAEECQAYIDRIAKIENRILEAQTELIEMQSNINQVNKSIN